MNERLFLGTFIRLFSLVQLKNLFGVVDTEILRPHVDPEPILQKARRDYSSAHKGDLQRHVLEAKRLHEVYIFWFTEKIDFSAPSTISTPSETIVPQ